MDWVFVVVLWLGALITLLVAAAEKSLIGIIVTAGVVLLAIGWTYLLSRRRKVGFQKGKELIHHLQGIGVQASMAERAAKEKRIGCSFIWARRSECVVRIYSKNIDYINVMTEINRWWGVIYLFFYLVQSSGSIAKEQVIGQNVSVIPKGKHGYTIIRTPDALPSLDMFEQLDLVARNIKAMVPNAGYI